MRAATKTYQPKAKDIKREWHLIDASDQILGRMSTSIAGLLMGKHKVDYAPHLDMGDHVVVVNAAKVRLSGNKEDKKVYYKHSGYPGGFKEVAYKKLKAEQPEKVINMAVKRMLPDNRLRKPRLTRLFIFAGEEHPYKSKLNKD